MGRDVRKNWLGPEFFQREAEVVARELIGCILVRRHKDTVYRVRLVETEAYVGAHDLACHAAKGRTNRTETLYLAGGHAYVYLIYGVYKLMNVVTGPAEEPQAVLLRAAEGLEGFKEDMSGPGKLTRALHIGLGMNGETVWEEGLHFLPREEGDVPLVKVSARVGVEYAKEWKAAELRFYDGASGAVSGKEGRGVRRGKALGK